MWDTGRVRVADAGKELYDCDAATVERNADDVWARLEGKVTDEKDRDRACGVECIFQSEELSQSRQEMSLSRDRKPSQPWELSQGEALGRAVEVGIWEGAGAEMGWRRTGRSLSRDGEETGVRQSEGEGAAESKKKTLKRTTAADKIMQNGRENENEQEEKSWVIQNDETTITEKSEPQ